MINRVLDERDRRIARNSRFQLSGKVASVRHTTAYVYIGSSSTAIPCAIPNGMKVSPGDNCTVIRVGHLRDQWRISDSEPLYQGDVETDSSSSTSSPPALIPSGFSVDSIVGGVIASWNGYTGSPDIIYEVQHTEDPDSSWESFFTRGNYAILVTDNPKHFRIRTISGNLSVSPFSESLLASPLPVPSSVTSPVILPFNVSSASPLKVATLSPGTYVTEVTVAITTPFNSQPSISVGEAGATSRYIASSETSPLSISSSTVVHSTLMSVETDINLYFSKGSATSGAGTVILHFKEP